MVICPMRGVMVAGTTSRATCGPAGRQAAAGHSVAAGPHARRAASANIGLAAHDTKNTISQSGSCVDILYNNYNNTYFFLGSYDRFYFYFILWCPGRYNTSYVLYILSASMYQPPVRIQSDTIHAVLAVPRPRYSGYGLYQPLVRYGRYVSAMKNCGCTDQSDKTFEKHIPKTKRNKTAGVCLFRGQV